MATIIVGGLVTSTLLNLLVLPAILLHFGRFVPGRPTVIIANTIKGKGVSYMECIPSWHGSVKLKPEEIRQALADLGVPPERQPEYAFHV